MRSCMLVVLAACGGGGGGAADATVADGAPPPPMCVDGGVVGGDGTIPGAITLPHPTIRNLTAGAAPDLGAHELGAAPPAYGPR